MVEECDGYCKGYVVDISKKEEVYRAAEVIRHEVGDVSILFFFTLLLMLFNHFLANIFFIRSLDCVVTLELLS